MSDIIPNLENMTDAEKKAALDAIQISIAKSKEVQKQRIGENVGLVIDALKKIESDIQSRYDLVGNTLEKRVATIKDGKDGKDGRDGRNGRDGLNGKQGVQGIKGEDGRDGRDGVDGIDGVSVTSARIDFDGSLVISLSSGIELNVGEVVAPDLAESIKVITNGGGTSQSVLDTLASLQTQITNLIPSQTGNSGKFLTTNGTATSWATVSGGGGLSYQGTWNATTNTPTLASSTGTNGYYYIVATAGSTNLNGITDWQIGDWLLFNGSVWQKIDQSNLVTSVNGYTGTVVLTQTDISGTASLTTTQTLTNKTLTSPIINEILDANGNEILGLSPTTSATDFLTVKNGIGVGVPLHVYADGSSSNIGLHIQPKGTGLVTISDGTDFNKGIRFRSSSSSTSAVTLIDAVSTAGRVVTLPDATTTLVGRDTTDTLTNKTLTSPTLTTPILGTPQSGNFSTGTFTWPTFNQNTTGTASNVTGTVAIANGGTGQTTQQAALTALSGTQTSGQYLRSNGTNTLLSAIQAADVPTLNQNTSGSAASLSATLAIASGGTGQTTANTAFNALAPSQTSNSGKYLTTDGTNSSWASVSASAATPTALGTVYGNTLSGGLLTTAVGYESLDSNTAGVANTAFGYRALKSNTTDSNTAFGYRALTSTTTGGSNIGIGVNAGATLTTGASNIFMGEQCGNSSTTATNNVCIGRNSGAAVTTGGSNTLVGIDSGLQLTTGSLNVMIGRYAGQSLTTGSYNIHIGYGTTVGSASVTDEIVISTSGNTGKGTNTGFISPNGGGVYQGNNSSSWSTTSDFRLKKNIVDNTEGLDKITQIQVRNFEYKLPEEVTELDSKNAIDIGGVQLGVIAQELQAVLPNCVKQESTGVLTVDSDNLTWYLINAVKELKAELDALKAKVA